MSVGEGYNPGNPGEGTPTRVPPPGTPPSTSVSTPFDFVRAPVGRFVNWLSTVAGGYIYGRVPGTEATTNPVGPPHAHGPVAPGQGYRHVVHAAQPKTAIREKKARRG